MSNDKADRSERDANGRWRKGYCPNPKGRPKKKIAEAYNPSDIRHFGNTCIDVMSNGRMETVDRRTALLTKMYESAMKGKVSMQRFLYREFERNDEQLAELRIRYEKLLRKWVLDNPDYKPTKDDSIPSEVRLEIAQLQSLLNHYYPGQYQDLDLSPEEPDVEGFEARLAKLMKKANTKNNAKPEPEHDTEPR